MERYLAVLWFCSRTERFLVGQRNGRACRHDSVYYHDLDGAKPQYKSSGVYSHGDIGGLGCSVVAARRIKSWRLDPWFVDDDWLAVLRISHYDHHFCALVGSLLWAMEAATTAAEAASVKQRSTARTRMSVPPEVTACETKAVEFWTSACWPPWSGGYPSPLPSPLVGEGVRSSAAGFRLSPE